MPPPRGQKNALTTDRKRGALLFFGSAGCVACHKVSGQSNEMFSDFSQHVIGVPQIAPAPGDPAAGNMTFDGPGQNEDFGLEQITGDANDRYKFRTSPLRNVALQPTSFTMVRSRGWRTRSDIISMCSRRLTINPSDIILGDRAVQLICRPRSRSE